MPNASTPRPRRTGPQRLLITFNAFALVAAAATAAILAYSNDRIAGLQRVDLSDVTEADKLAEGDPQNYLVVGVDDASGLPKEDSVRKREFVAGLHTDTMMIVRVDPKAGTADLLSLPRDLWVPIAETESNQRINTALETGGPRRLIKTIDENFGIPIHHYVQIDFAGFRKLIQIVDGVPVQFPHPARAKSSGVAIESAGCWTLGPVQALAFSRARKDYQVQDADGDWHIDLGGDHTRIERQQLLIRLALRRAVSKGARNPNTLRRLIDLGVETVRIDDALDADNLVDLGRRFRSFDPEELVTHTLPVFDEVIGEAEVLILDEEAAEATFAVFPGVGPTGRTVSPEDVTVQVLNGTGVSGQGADVTDELVAEGFEAVVPDDADAEDPATTIQYVVGSEAAAQLVARYVDGRVRYEAVDNLDGADVVLVTGSDWKGVAASVRPLDEIETPPAPTTTTTTTSTPGGSDGGPTTGSDDPGTTTGTTGAGPPAGDPNDPDDPAFYRAQPPGADAECSETA